MSHHRWFEMRLDAHINQLGSYAYISALISHTTCIVVNEGEL